MATSEHTPGPWERDGMQVKKGNRLIAYTEFVGDIPLDEDIANARLIAAAPLLLEALLHIRNEVQGMRFFEREVRDVLGNTNWSVLRTRVDEADAAIAAAGVEGER